MPRLPSLALLFALVIASGCGKKPAPAPDSPPQTDPPREDKAAWRTKQLTAIRSTNQDTRRAAADELSWLVNEDPEVAPALLELLKDKSTAGPGQTIGTQLCSVRQAAAVALLKSGAKGEAILKEKGLENLRPGLTDPTAAVREHTAFTLGQLGPVAALLAPDVQMLCTDPDEHVRGAAFDALKVLGVPNPVALVKLLTDEREDVVRLAAEVIPTIEKMPADAVPLLIDALKSKDIVVRSAAAQGLAAAGPLGASADAIGEAIDAAYADADAPVRLDGPETVLWNSLVRLGEPAVAPLVKLLGHKNVFARYLAARALGDVGPVAKAAKDALLKAFNDMYVNVAAEAAITLCRLGEATDDAANLVKRALDAPAPGVAAVAIRGIPRMGTYGKELIPLAAAKMTSDDAETRAAAVELVGLLPPAETKKYVPELAKRVGDEDSRVSAAAARVLARLGPDATEAAEALRDAILAAREAGDTAEELAEALIAMGPGAKPAVPGLLVLVTDETFPVELRARVIAAVAAADPASPDVAAALVKALDAKQSKVKVAAATALGGMDPLPPAAVAALVKMAKTDRDFLARPPALKALVKAGPRAKSAKPELEAIANGQFQDVVAFWAKVAVAAVDGDVQKAAPTIRAGLTDRKSRTIRGAAAEALLLVGPTAAELPALVRLLSEPDAETRIAAATAIGRVGDPAKEHIPQLIRLLTDSDPEVRIAAANALARFGPAAAAALPQLQSLLTDKDTRAAAQRALEKIKK